jgi:hypothetical protein
MVDVHALDVDAEFGQPVALRAEVLLLDRDTGVPDQHSGHDSPLVG